MRSSVTIKVPATVSLSGWNAGVIFPLFRNFTYFSTLCNSFHFAETEFPIFYYSLVLRLSLAIFFVIDFLVQFSVSENYYYYMIGIVETCQ